MLQPWAYDLRSWQESAFYRYVTANKRNFLLVATPGAGKTIAAARIAHHLFDTGAIDRLVVVCPTEHLKRQWHDTLARFGIQIDYKWRNASGAVASDYHGVAVTYQQVASNPDLHRMHCRRRTLFIGDEIHHAGDDRSWGMALQGAFEPATHRLLTSGTPFRADGAIPFVDYEEDENGILRSKADFHYGYGAALGDGVCRPVLFPSYEGTMEWLSGAGTVRATFRDALPEDEARRRLRTALDPDGEWIREVLRAADQRLTELRANGHPDAGGLILCSDTTHARRIGEVLRRVTGETATIVLSDEDGASERIASFTRSTTRWIVAVRMVSEGVDIPRLRVGVYATTTIAELFFRQVVGRFVRLVNGIDEQSAFLYIPKEELLVSFAQCIKEERDHQLEQELDNLDTKVREVSARQESLYAPIAAAAQADDVIFDHQSLQQREIEEARMVALQCGVTSVPFEVIARMFRVRGTPLVEDAPAAPKVDSMREQKDKLRKVIKRMVVQLVHVSGQALDYPTVYSTINRLDGLRVESATVDGLTKRVEYLRDWIARYRHG